MDCRAFFYTQKSERRCANACSFDRHRLAPICLGFRAGVLRQRHGCSPDRGDCHSFHFPPRRLRELKKKIHFFIKGLDKTKKSCHTATITTRLLLEDDSRFFFQKSIRKSFNSRILFVGDFFYRSLCKTGWAVDVMRCAKA